MLHSITYQLREALEARGVPYPVVYGPERMEQSALSYSHVVIERDRDVGDLVATPPAIQRNPRAIMARDIGAICRVYARSTLDGAGPQDHERVADQVIDQVLLALRVIVSGRRVKWEVGAGRLLNAAELGELGLHTWPGVIYEQRFAVGRAVLDRPYDGERANEATMGGAGGVTVSTTMDTGNSPEQSSDLPGATTR